MLNNNKMIDLLMINLLSTKHNLGAHITIYLHNNLIHITLREHFSKNIKGKTNIKKVLST